MTTWIDQRDAGTGVQPERTALERRVEELERQVHDLTEWLAAVADDMLERTGAV